MSKLFFDNLIELKTIEVEIKKSARSKEEQEELWMLIDEIFNHKVIEKILDHLPRENHEEFLEIFHKRPYDEEYIFAYLREKSGENIIDVLKRELTEISSTLLADIKSLRK
jgi:hypothetical protein